ncbi:YbeD-like domain superfamily [Sesbania bispinosa]|nr:YbeD-like domain superfamily [Sesbania bispinosa]
MACRSFLRSTILVEPFPLRPFNFNFNHYHIPSPYNCNNLRTITLRQFHPPKSPLSCSVNETSPYHDDDQDPPQEAVLKAISEVSKTEGRVGQTTNMVLGGTVTDDSTDEWLALDQKVNSYPTVRGFTAIGTGGEDFVQAMIVAVESVIQQPIPQGHVKQKLSSGGKYVSVNIGPIEVVSSEQVQAVYNAMRRDDRMKYFL